MDCDYHNREEELDINLLTDHKCLVQDMPFDHTSQVIKGTDEQMHLVQLDDTGLRLVTVS